jgi:hypothetical protein
MNNSTKLFMNEWKIYSSSIAQCILLLTYQSGWYGLYNNGRVVVYLYINWTLWDVSDYAPIAEQCSLNLENFVEIQKDKST